MPLYLCYCEEDGEGPADAAEVYAGEAEWAAVTLVEWWAAKWGDDPEQPRHVRVMLAGSGTGWVRYRVTGERVVEYFAEQVGEES